MFAVRFLDILTAGSLLWHSEARAGAPAENPLLLASFSDRPRASETIPAQSPTRAVKGQLALHGDLDRPLSKESTAAIKRLFELGGTMRLVLALPGEEFDRVYDGRRTRAFPLSLSSFEQTQFTSVTVPGQVVAILVDLPERVKTIDKGARLINGRSWESEAWVKDGNSSAAIWDAESFEQIKVGDIIKRAMIVSPPPPLRGSDDRVLSIGLDLTPLGLGRVEQVFLTPRLEPLLRADGLSFYTDLLRTNSRDKVSGISEDVIQGLKTVSSFLGIDSLLIKGVYVPDAKEANAFIQLNDPSTLIITDELLRFKPELGVSVRHESWHSFDISRNLSRSTDFAAAYAEIQSSNPEFLSKLSESRRSRELRFAGHAEDNVYEAFASFGNFLMELDSRPEAANLYRKTKRDLNSLIRLSMGFESALLLSGIPDNAPVHGALRRLRQEISSGIAH